MEAASKVRFMHCMAMEQACWLEALQDSPLWFVINFTEMVLNIFMMPTGRPDLYFHYLVDIINFC